MEGVALHRAGRRARRELAGVEHGPERVPDTGDLVGAGVEGDHGRPPAGRLEGMAAEPATQIEHTVAGSYT